MLNQTELHYELTKKTAAWLAYKTTGRGMKWMQEFTLLNKLRPDAVAFCDLQQKYYEEFTKDVVNWNHIRSELRKVNQFYAHERMKIGNSDGLIEDWQNAKISIFEEYNVPENRFMFVFETKVTLSDFKSTFVNGNHKVSKCEPFGNFHFLVCSSKLFKDNLIIHTLPDFYGILKESGKGLRIMRMSKYRQMDELDFYKNAYNMMFRIDSVRNILRQK